MSAKKGRGLSGSRKKRAPTTSKRGVTSATRGVKKKPRVVSSVSAGVSEEVRDKLESLESEFGWKSTLISRGKAIPLHVCLYSVHC